MVPGGLHLGRAAGRGLFKQVLAHGHQAGRVQKTGDLQLAQHLLAAGVQFHRHRSVPANGDGRGVIGDGDGRHNGRAAGGHQLPGGGYFEAAVTRVSGGAVRLGDLEVALARNGDVQWVLAVDHIALGIEFFGGYDAHAGT